jgi:hypothetical protein
MSIQRIDSKQGRMPGWAQGTFVPSAAWRVLQGRNW